MPDPVAKPVTSLRVSRRRIIGRRAEISKNHKWRRQATTVAVAIVLFAVALWINLSRLERTDLHPDETRWVNRAYYIREFSDPYGAFWQDYYITRGQPPGGSYLMGLGLWLQNQPLDSNGVWDFHFSNNWNKMAGAIPAHDVLMAGRRTNAVVGSLVVVLVFAIVTLLTNRVGGVVAGLFLAYHPLQITLSTQALSDELLAFSLALAFFSAFKFGQHRHLAWALVLGAALGVGGATKLAPLALAFIVAGYGVAWMIWTATRSGWKTFTWSNGKFGYLLVLQPAIAGFVFVALYPFLWPSPISRSLALLNFRRQEMASQARIWPWAKVDTPLDALMRYGQQLDGAYSTTKHFQQSILERIGLDIVHPIGLDFIGIAIGAILLARIVIYRGLWSPHALTALLMAAEVATVTVGLGVDFYRYYLPILLVNSVLVGVAFGEAGRVIQSIWSGNTKPGSAAPNAPTTTASRQSIASA